MPEIVDQRRSVRPLGPGSQPVEQQRIANQDLAEVVAGAENLQQDLGHPACRRRDRAASSRAGAPRPGIARGWPAPSPDQRSAAEWHRAETASRATSGKRLGPGPSGQDPPGRGSRARDRELPAEPATPAPARESRDTSETSRRSSRRSQTWWWKCIGGRLAVRCPTPETRARSAIECCRWRKIDSTSARLSPRLAAIFRSSTPRALQAARRRRQTTAAGCRERRLRDIPAVRLPGVAKIPESRVEPVFPASLPQQLEKPLLEASGDDARRAARFVIARREDRIAAARQAIGQVDADGLEAGVAQLEPALGLNDHLRHAGKWNHRADRGDRMDERPAAEETVREPEPRLQAVRQLIAVALLPVGNRARVRPRPARLTVRRETRSRAHRPRERGARRSHPTQSSN